MDLTACSGIDGLAGSGRAAGIGLQFRFKIRFGRGLELREKFGIHRFRARNPSDQGKLVPFGVFISRLLAKEIVR